MPVAVVVELGGQATDFLLVSLYAELVSLLKPLFEAFYLIYKLNPILEVINCIAVVIKLQDGIILKHVVLRRFFL